jgi:hypothetical protein
MIGAGKNYPRAQLPPVPLQHSRSFRHLPPLHDSTSPSTSATSWQLRCSWRLRPTGAGRSRAWPERVICADDKELARGVAGMLMLSHPQHESPPEQAVRRMTSPVVRFPAKVYSARQSSGWHAATAATAPATFAPSVREPPMTAPRAEQRRHARNNFGWNQLSWMTSPRSQIRGVSVFRRGLDLTRGKLLIGKVKCVKKESPM